MWRLVRQSKGGTSTRSRSRRSLRPRQAKTPEPMTSTKESRVETMADSTSEKIRESIDQNKIVIYMKGTPSFPMCGFSAATIEVFNEIGVPYETVDVLKDPEIREGI